MRALPLCLALVLISGCDTTAEPAALDRTSFQIRINDPGIERVQQRFTRSETEATVGVRPAACGGETLLSFSARNATGEALRLQAIIEGDGTLQEPATVEIAPENIEGDVRYTGDLPGARDRTSGIEFTVARGVFSVTESSARGIAGALQVSGSGNGLDFDATASFDVVPVQLGCGT